MLNFKEWNIVYEALTEDRKDTMNLADYYAEQAAKADDSEYFNTRCKECTDRLEVLNGIIAKIEATTF